MIRLGLYITLAIFIALGAGWLANHPGQILLNWQGWEVRMSVAVLWLLIFLYTVLGWILFRLYRYFGADNPLNSPKRREARRKQGLAQLDLGWSALAVEDKVSALKYGKKAHGLLPDDHGPLRLLLKVAPDQDRQKYLIKLEDDPKNRMVALKCRLDREREAENNQAALNLLEEMRQLAPGNPWISRKRFDIFTRLGRWTEATGELDRLVKAKAIDKGEQKHLRAVLCYCLALEADLGGDKKAARNHIRHALKHDQGFLPAAMLRDRNNPEKGNKTGAIRADQDSGWQCQSCGASADKYTALCPQCHDFGTIE